MRVALVVDGEPSEVEVDLVAGTATTGGRSFPVRVISQSPARIELEVGGEKVVVEGWIAGVPSPSDPVSVNGERYRVESSTSGPPTARPPAPSAPGDRSPSLAGPPGPGAIITPPMPGRVVEVRVREGDLVTAGQVLLVLEAMKMRNEILSPSAGRVAELRVAPGANVRAREAMLRILPG